jgi:hypothetical protein
MEKINLFQAIFLRFMEKRVGGTASSFLLLAHRRKP